MQSSPKPASRCKISESVPSSQGGSPDAGGGSSLDGSWHTHHDVGHRPATAASPASEMIGASRTSAVAPGAGGSPYHEDPLTVAFADDDGDLSDMLASQGAGTEHARGASLPPLAHGGATAPRSIKSGFGSG